MNSLTEKVFEPVAGNSGTPVHETVNVLAVCPKVTLPPAAGFRSSQRPAARGGPSRNSKRLSLKSPLAAPKVRLPFAFANEREADDYAMQFMSRRKYDRKACVSALDKLAKMSGGGGEANWLSTHPSPKERADRMRKQLA